MDVSDKKLESQPVIFKSGFVGVIGLPNAGKSTLVNLLVGEKVGIVTPKPQTTRQKILGVLTQDNYQCVFADAPGVIQAESGINHFIQKEYEGVIADSDVLLAVLNIDESKPERLQNIIDLVAKSGKPWMVVISKVDLGRVHRVDHLELILKDYNVPIVATKVHSKFSEEKLSITRQSVLSCLKTLLPDGPQLYDEEVYTTHTVRELCSEIIREHCLRSLHQEIPYESAVRIVKFDDSNEKIDRVYAEIIVDKISHKSIVIGTGGQVIKRIGTSARKEIEVLTGKKLFLDLHVSVEPHWVKNNKKMKELGYEIN